MHTIWSYLFFWKENVHVNVYLQSSCCGIAGLGSSFVSAVAWVTSETHVWSLYWRSRLRIQHCHSCSLGRSYSLDLISGLGTSIWHRCSQKKNPDLIINDVLPTTIISACCLARGSPVPSYIHPPFPRSMDSKLTTHGCALMILCIDTLLEIAVPGLGHCQQEAQMLPLCPT